MNYCGNIAQLMNISLRFFQKGNSSIRKLFDIGRSFDLRIGRQKTLNRISIYLFLPLFFLFFLSFLSFSAFPYATVHVHIHTCNWLIDLLIYIIFHCYRIENEFYISLPHHSHPCLISSPNQEAKSKNFSVWKMNMLIFRTIPFKMHISHLLSMKTKIATIWKLFPYDSSRRYYGVEGGISN